MIAGNFVIPAAALLGPNTLGSAVIHETPPIRGMVESLIAGAPPTSVVVNWQDGTRVTYATSGTGPTSVLYTVGSGSGALLVGSVVRAKQGSGIPSPGGRLQGPVVTQFSLNDPSTDAPVVEIVVIQTPLGFLVADIAQVEVVPSA
jgi:hypothetical protein